MRTISFLPLLVLLSCGSTGSSPRTGTPSPDATVLELQDIDGLALDLNGELAEGRQVALVFWQTWCESCLAEGPALGEAARRLEDTVRFCGVVPGPDDVVDLDEVRRVAREMGLSYPQVRDRDLVLTSAFDVRGTPTIIVLEGQREVVFRGHRLPEAWR